MLIARPLATVQPARVAGWVIPPWTEKNTGTTVSINGAGVTGCVAPGLQTPNQILKTDHQSRYFGFSLFPV